MKRSKMVQIIYEELIFSRTPQHGIRITNSPADKKIADQILKRIEEENMLPPCIDKSNEHANARFIYQWEPEDE